MWYSKMYNLQKQRGEWEFPTGKEVGDWGHMGQRNQNLIYAGGESSRDLLYNSDYS
jgi:hypothetical protein